MHDGVVLVICISGRDGPQRLETNNLTHTQPFAGRNQSSSIRKQADRRLYEWKNGKSLYLTYPSSSCLELEVEKSSLRHMLRQNVLRHQQKKRRRRRKRKRTTTKTLISSG